jgi:hypothetical protein
LKEKIDTKPSSDLTTLITNVKSSSTEVNINNIQKYFSNKMNNIQALDKLNFIANTEEAAKNKTYRNFLFENTDKEILVE